MALLVGLLFYLAKPCIASEQAAPRCVAVVESSSIKNDNSKGTKMSNIFTFIGGSKGPWSVKKITTVKGRPIAEVSALRIAESDVTEKNSEEKWLFRGFTSNVRYATSDEVASLKKLQPEIGRKEATCAAMILVKKSDSWWQLAQDQRRKIFEEQSHHNSIGMDYLPAVARRLHHSRDLGEEFDFITWFEFAPSDIAKFDELVARLRASEEWTYVDREIDVRLEQRQAE